eukprot:1123522-Amphidinium_carterae.2
MHMNQCTLIAPPGLLGEGHVSFVPHVPFQPPAPQHYAVRANCEAAADRTGKGLVLALLLICLASQPLHLVHFLFIHCLMLTHAL